MFVDLPKGHGARGRRRKDEMGRGLCKAGGSVVLVCALAARVNAHETDQFTVPVGKRFADLGDYLAQTAYDTIDGAVRGSTTRI